jgi:hypothetical protein
MLQLSARFSAAWQAFGSANSKTAQIDTTITPVGTVTQPMLCGPTSSDAGSLNWQLCTTSSLPQVQRAVMQVALDKMFKARHFSICDLDSIMLIAHGHSSRICKPPAYTLLHALHCVDYAAMSTEVRDSIPALVRECLEPVRSHEATAAIMGSL